MTLIQLGESQLLGRELRLDSAEGHPIPNWQGVEISAFERNSFPQLERRFGSGAHLRCEATARYNCHGLAFAARRTSIDQTDAVHRILRDDGYLEIGPKQVLPGDLVLYYSEEGDLEHSAIVIEPPTPDRIGIPLVVSKWGRYRELVHAANNCPYVFGYAKYFRVQQV